MKKILLIAAVAVMAMGCCKKATCQQDKCCDKPTTECCEKKAECPKAECAKAECAKTDACCEKKAECPKKDACCEKKAECAKKDACCEKKAECPKAE
jgi:hypothetical protein